MSSVRRVSSGSLLHGCRQSNVSAIDFGRKIIIVAGSGYTGEIKKGMFSVMNFILPVQHDVLPMHCSSNQDEQGNVAVFLAFQVRGRPRRAATPTAH